jgi:hypothetical protein
MQGCLIHALLGVALYVASFFCLHAIAHCQAEESVELPSLVELSTACAPEVEFRRRSLTVEGRPGLWFDERVAACMAGRLALVPELRRLVTVLELRVERTDAHVALLERQLALSREIEAELERALQAAERTSERERRWHRRPGLWWAVGVVSAVALQVATTRTVGALTR